MKKLFRGGVSGSSVTLSSKTIETSSFVTNAFAMVVPSEFFVIATFLSCFIAFAALRVSSEAFVKLDCLSIVSNTEIFLSSFQFVPYT